MLITATPKFTDLFDSERKNSPHYNRVALPTTDRQRQARRYAHGLRARVTVIPLGTFQPLPIKLQEYRDAL
jgi:hypothetical protein